MARGEAISDLYLRLGLQYDELQSDFVQAGSTIQTNMARLSRENTTIRLQAQVELSGLDEATDAAQIFNIRTQALNRQIANQRDRVNMANAQLRNMATAHGENSDQAQRARIAFERERLALADLERELQNLNETQEETNSGTGGFLENLQGMAEKAAPVVAGITAIAGALQLAADYSVELIEKFSELQNQSYELNMTFGEAKKFLRQLRLSGGDYGDYEGFVRGLSDAMIKGEVDDPEAIVFARYGESAFDASGYIKSFDELDAAIKRMYDRAKAAGEEIEFLQMLGGESGVRDAIQYLERWKEGEEDAAKIFDSGINPDELHKSERALNLLTEQVGEFKDALTDVITPATQAAMEGLFEVFHSGTKFVAENKDEIRRWGDIAAKALSNFSGNAILSNLQNVFSGFSELSNKLKEFKDVKLDFGDAGQNAQYDNFLQGVDDLNQNTLRNYFRDLAYDEIIGRATASQKVFNATLKDTGTAYADMSKKIAQAISQSDQLSQYGIQRINQFRDELDDLRIELDFGDNEYGKAKAQLDLWLQRELSDKLYVSRDEENTIRELYAAKNEQIERERAAKIEEIRENAEQARRTDLENTLADIEEEKEKRINAGMAAAEAIRIAAEESTNAINELEDAFTEKVNSFRDNTLQKQFSAIDKDRDSWIQKGIEPERANAFADEQKTKALQDLEKSFSKRVNEIRGNDLANQLARIDEEKQSWIDKGIDEARAEELANAQKGKAIQDFAKQNEDAAGKIRDSWEQAWEKASQAVSEQFDRALSVLKSQLEAFRAYLKDGAEGLYQYELKQLKKQGITEKDLKSMTVDNLEGFQKAQKDIRKNLLPNFNPTVQIEIPGMDEFTKSLNGAVSAVDEFSKKLANVKTSNSDESGGLQTERVQLPDAIEEWKKYETATREMPYRFAGFAETEGRKHWLYQKDLYDIDPRYEPVNQNFNDRDFTDALDALNYLNRDNPNYVKPPEGTDLEAELVGELRRTFGDLGNNFVSITDSLGKVTQAVIDNVTALALAEKNSAGSLPNRTSNINGQPANITANVSINEAHAWDYSHIQVLAEKVADVLTPRILRAIGGDSNSY